MKNQISIGAVGRLILLMGITSVIGCASITNPVANGVPARLLPPELLAQSREELVQTPLDWLRVTPPDKYTLDTGDILGVYIEGALGQRDQLPPINFPQVANLPPSMGFPIPVGADGTVSLPLVKTVKVAGLTVPEAQEAIESAYTESQKVYLNKEMARVVVSLVRPRQARILVIREDSPFTRPSLNDPTFRLFGSSPSLGRRGQGSGRILEIAEVEADVLSVLASSGGLPGPTASDEVVIYRGMNGPIGPNGLELPQDWQTTPPAHDRDKPRVIRIPLRIKPGDRREFTEEDIHLQSGDIVFVPPRETDVYYTGGLLPAREVPLPRDNDIRIVEAILRVGGPVISGGSIVGGLSGSTSLITGAERSSPSLVTLLRRTPNGNQINIRVDLNRALQDTRENLLVQPGDILVLQETPSESVARYVMTVFNFGVFGRYMDRQDATGTATLQLP